MNIKLVTDFMPLAAVGFIVGAGLGFAWGKKAKSRIGESVSTDVSDGVVRVEIDTYQAARAGLSDSINNFFDGI